MQHWKTIHINLNCIGGVIQKCSKCACLECGSFWSCRMKDNKIGICSFSAKEKDQNLFGQESE